MFGLIEFSGSQDPHHPYFQLSFLRNFISVICLIPLGEGQSRDEKDVCTQISEGPCVTAACGVCVRQFCIATVCNFQ